jgi:hypothetical protein
VVKRLFVRSSVRAPIMSTTYICFLWLSPLWRGMVHLKYLHMRMICIAFLNWYWSVVSREDFQNLSVHFRYYLTYGERHCHPWGQIQDKGAALFVAGNLGAALVGVHGAKLPNLRDFRGLQTCFPRSHFSYISVNTNKMAQNLQILDRNIQFSLQK